MKIGFAGTPAFAQTVLEALVDAGRQVEVVLTQPDRPAGRGMKLTASAVKQFALDREIAVLQPAGLRLDGRHSEDAQAARDALQALDLDVLIVVAYGLILPKWVLEMPRLGCLNIHASLLPRWRGAAPIQRAIEAGDEQTGITIMQMDEGLDTGDILMMTKLAIEPQDNAQSLHDRLAALACQTINEALVALEAGQLVARAQPEEGVTYAEKLDKAQALLSPDLPATVLARKVRAFDPFPGARLALPGLAQPVRVFRAQALPDESPQGAPMEPGAVVATGVQGIDVLTTQGVLRVTELQRAGGRRQDAASFLAGWRVADQDPPATKPLKP